MLTINPNRQIEKATRMEWEKNEDLLTQDKRARSRGVRRSKTSHRISSGRTRRSPRASGRRSLIAGGSMDGSRGVEGRERGRRRGEGSSDEGSMAGDWREWKSIYARWLARRECYAHYTRTQRKKEEETRNAKEGFFWGQIIRAHLK